MSERLEEIRKQTYRPVKKEGGQIIYGDWIVSDENYQWLSSQAQQLEEAQERIKKLETCLGALLFKLTNEQLKPVTLNTVQEAHQLLAKE